MKNNETLQISINTFLEERLQESYQNVQQRHNYKEIEHQYYDVFQNVKNELIHKEELLEQYETLLAQMYEVQLKEAYCTGINDMRKIFFYKELS